MSGGYLIEGGALTEPESMVSRLRLNNSLASRNIFDALRFQYDKPSGRRRSEGNMSMNDEPGSAASTSVKPASLTLWIRGWCMSCSGAEPYTILMMIDAPILSDFISHGIDAR